MFYDGILATIISKSEANHEIINDALNYLKVNNISNAKVLTDIPYLMFKNLDFLTDVNSYTLINIKSSINEYKREIDINTIKEVLKKYITNAEAYKVSDAKTANAPIISVEKKYPDGKPIVSKRPYIK